MMKLADKDICKRLMCEMSDSCPLYQGKCHFDRRFEGISNRVDRRIRLGHIVENYLDKLIRRMPCEII